MQIHNNTTIDNMNIIIKIISSQYEINNEKNLERGHKKKKIRIWIMPWGLSLPSRIANETRHRVHVYFFISFSFCLFILISGIIINIIISYYFHYNIILLLLLLYAWRDNSSSAHHIKVYTYNNKILCAWRTGTNRNEQKKKKNRFSF